MLPVNGARTELEWRGSSRSLMFDASIYVSVRSSGLAAKNTIVWIYEILLDLSIVVILIGITRRCTCHHGHGQIVLPAATK